RTIASPNYFCFPASKKVECCRPEMKRLQKKRYDSLTLLGNTQVTFPASPADAKLETFTNRSKHRNYFIRINSHEFTSLCPVTGQPDFAEISVEYVPNELCLETKSLKLYL